MGWPAATRRVGTTAALAARISFTFGMLAADESQHRLIARSELNLRLSKLRNLALPEQVHYSAERGINQGAAASALRWLVYQKRGQCTDNRFNWLRYNLPGLYPGQKGMYVGIQDNVLLHEPLPESIRPCKTGWFLYQMSKPDG